MTVAGTVGPGGVFNGTSHCSSTEIFPMTKQNSRDQILDPEVLQQLSTTPEVLDFVLEWAQWTSAERVELITGTPDEIRLHDQRLVRESIDAGELVEIIDQNNAPTGTYWARSHPADTARTVERTFVATNSIQGRGRLNNWLQHDEAWHKVRSLTQGASENKTLYAIPYMMSNHPEHPIGSKYGLGIELTDSRYVALNMLRMTRTGSFALDLIHASVKKQKESCGLATLNDVEIGKAFVRAVNITGNLDTLSRTNDETDDRWFVTFPDTRFIVHHGSAYGGNALLGKIAHGLRLASADAQKNRWLAEQMMIIGVRDKLLDKSEYVVAAYPSASGKTNTAAMAVPESLSNRFEVTFLGDDIAWMYVGEDDQLYAMNPEAGCFGVAIDTRFDTAPNLVSAVSSGSGTIWTNVGFNTNTRRIWYEGNGEPFPDDLADWIDYKGEAIEDRPVSQQRSGDFPWAHPNSRFASPLKKFNQGSVENNVSNLDPLCEHQSGVPISAILFGGRLPYREPLVRIIDNSVDGLYDGFVLGVVKTAAVDGADGKFGPDPMTMGAFFGPSETDYIENWLDVIHRSRDKVPTFAHVNYFLRWSAFEDQLENLGLEEAYQQRKSDFIWPGYGWNILEILWVLRSRNSSTDFKATAVGRIPENFLSFEQWLGLSDDEANEVRTELHRDVSESAVNALFHIDPEAWVGELERRDRFLANYPDMPDEFLDAHTRFRRNIETIAPSEA